MTSLGTLRLRALTILEFGQRPIEGLSPVSADRTFWAVNIICAVAFSATTAVTLDDTYVYLRSVQNWIAYGKPVFNPGDNFGITTSPLWLIVLTIFKIVFPVVSLTTISKVLTVVFLFLGSWMAKRLVTPISVLAGVLAPVALFFSPLIHTLVGHDTAITLFVAFGTMSAFYGKDRWLPLWVAALYLARGEGAVIGSIIAIAALVRAAIQKQLVSQIKEYLLPAVVGMAAIALWHSVHYFWFGEVLPSTLNVKRMQGEAGWTLMSDRLTTHLSNVYQRIRNPILSGIVATTGIIGAIVSMRRPILLLWPAVHYAVYVSLGVAYYHWYMYPVDVVATLMICVGTGYWLTALVNVTIHKAPILIRSRSNAVVVCLLVLSGFVCSMFVEEAQRSFRQSLQRVAGYATKAPKWVDARFEEYSKLASQMLLDFGGEENPVLLTHEIGIFGYLMPRAYVRDVVGLATPVDTVGGFWDWRENVIRWKPDYIYYPTYNTVRMPILFKSEVGDIQIYEPVRDNAGPKFQSLYSRSKCANEEFRAGCSIVDFATAEPTKPLNFLTYDNDKAGIDAHAPSRFLFRVPEKASSVTFDVGFRNGAWTGESQTDGIGVKARLIPIKRKAHLAKTIMIDPVLNEADRRSTQFKINLPPDQSNLLMEISIDPLLTTSKDWSYVSPPRWSFEEVVKLDAKQTMFEPCPSYASITSNLVDTNVGWVDDVNFESNLVRVRGWAADIEESKLVEQVVIAVDKETVSCGQTYLHRHDVASAYGSEKLVKSGYESIFINDGYNTARVVTVYGQLSTGEFGRLANNSTGNEQ